MRKSYFAALNVFTGRVVIKKYEHANSESTIKFLQCLLTSNSNCKIVVFWDGAGYHRSDELKKFLKKINHGKKGINARLLLVRFAPNAPEENPVEDI